NYQNYLTELARRQKAKAQNDQQNATALANGQPLIPLDSGDDPSTLTPIEDPGGPPPKTVKETKRVPVPPLKDDFWDPGLMAYGSVTGAYNFFDGRLQAFANLTYNARVYGTEQNGTQQEIYGVFGLGVSLLPGIVSLVGFAGGSGTV